MLKKFLVGLFLLLPFFGSASIKPENLKLLRTYEDSMKVMGDSLVNGSHQAIRQEACFTFIKMLVKALKVENSFEYPFDSLKTIGILYPDNKKFRIFNWNLLYKNGQYRYYGAIQKNSGKVKVYPLYDYRHFFKKNPMDTITNNERWYGALYYKILRQGKYYMLFGWDGNDPHSSKKLVDVLTFGKKGLPVFGAPIFNVGTLKHPKMHDRFIIEYKKNAQVSIRYDAEMKMIIYDHLIPVDPNPNAKDLLFTYVPDGSYEGFEYKKKRWQHVSTIYKSTQATPPFPDPVDFNKPKPDYKKKKK